MSVPIVIKEPTIKSSDIDSWLKKHKLKKTQINITKATNALRAEKQADAIPIGKDVSYTGADAPRQIVYGECKMGGTIVFLDSRGNNQFIDIVIAIATHEIQGVTKLFLDDCEVLWQVGSDGWSASLRKPDGTIIPALNKIFLRVATGADNQSSILDLVAQNPGKWTTDHKLSGVAHAYLILVWDGFIFGDGIPDISFQVQGKKVYDARYPATRYTATAALVIADYLTNARFGVGVDYASRIDEGSLVDAANVCDETVTLQDGGTEYRYTINGYFNTDESHQNILERMAAAMGGHITYCNGKWKFWPAKWRAPTLTLTEDDLRSSVRMQILAGRDDIFNGVRGTYVSAAKDFTVIDYPPVKNSSYAVIDGDEIYENIDFHFVTSTPTCQRLAKLEIERVRQGIQVEVEVAPLAFQLQVPENVMLTIDRYGWVDKPFEVVRADFLRRDSGGSEEIVVALSLRETAEAVFEWNYWEETIGDVAPNTNLPSPFTVPAPTNLQLASGTAELYLRGDGTVAPRVRVSWDTFSDFFITSGGKVEVQFKLTSESMWIDATTVPGSSTVTYLADIQDGSTIDVRIRSVNTFGNQSDYVTVTNHFVVGKTAPPADVTGFAAALTEYGIQLAWTNIPDLDLGFYEIREGVSWTAGLVRFQNKATRVALDLRATGTHVFWIRAVDTSGNYSLNSASVSITVTAPTLPGATSAFAGPNIVIDWEDAIGGSWAIDGYTIYEGDVFASSVIVAFAKSTIFSEKVTWLGLRRYWIEPRDIFGNVGAAFSLDINVLAPNKVTNFSPTVSDNNVLLRWTAPAASTLPVEYYIVRRGDEYLTSTVIGSFTGTFCAIFELASGQYTYWVEAVDTAGNHGAAAFVTTAVLEPPDYELKADVTFTNGDTLLNVLERDGRIIGPVNTSRTWAQHFIVSGWSTPRDQIDAGFPYFIQPTRDYGRWEKIYDLGTTLNNVLIHLSFNRQDLVGAQPLTYKIGYSTDAVSYTEASDVFGVLASAVRYIRIRLDFGTVP